MAIHHTVFVYPDVVVPLEHWQTIARAFGQPFDIPASIAQTPGSATIIICDEADAADCKTAIRGAEVLYLTTPGPDLDPTITHVYQAVSNSGGFNRSIEFWDRNSGSRFPQMAHGEPFFARRCIDLIDIKQAINAQFGGEEIQISEQLSYGSDGLCVDQTFPLWQPVAVS